MSFNAVNSLVNLYGQGLEDRIPEEWFQEINKKDLKILEVGFGRGSMLKKLDRPDGPLLWGIDASQQNYRRAINELKLSANLSVLDLSHERIQLPDGEMDVVILLEVLEHLENPLGALIEIQRVLKKDGIFIFSFPEERLVSGIGKECNEETRSHGPGFHSFPIPGMFQYQYMRTLLNQLYLKIIDEAWTETYHIFFKMINTKKDSMHILDTVNNDADRKQLYGDIETPCKFPELLQNNK